VSGANVENRGRQFFLAVIRSRKMKYSCGVLKEERSDESSPRNSIVMPGTRSVRHRKCEKPVRYRLAFRAKYPSEVLTMQVLVLCM